MSCPFILSWSTRSMTKQTPCFPSFSLMGRNQLYINKETDDNALHSSPQHIVQKMKREGRQHGMVRTHRVIPPPWNPRPDARFINMIDSPPTSGLFTKVPTKPTNHSKFTGKCGKPRCIECHLHPASKSKEKTKGTQKLNSRDLVSNYKLITWRVVDGRPGLNFSGFSATGILDHLASDYADEEVDDNTNDEYEGHHDDTSKGEVWSQIEVEDRDEGRPDMMSFYDVGLVFDQIEGDEGWCVVGEI